MTQSFCTGSPLTFKLAATLLAAGAWLAPNAQAAGWDATADFSPTRNPNGAWSYGTTATLAAAFSSFATRHTELGGTGSADFWNDGGANNLPWLGKSGASGWDYITVAVDPNTLSAHPGPSGEYAVLRFTSALGGSYAVAASFWGQDFAGPTTTDVHVRSGGNDAFSADVNGFGAASAKSWSGTVTLGMGDSLDFAIGRGVDNDYRFSSTGLSATISVVPEPTAAGLMLAGLLGLTLLQRRSRG
jgi:hypothetical protein